MPKKWPRKESGEVSGGMLGEISGGIPGEVSGYSVSTENPCVMLISTFAPS